VQSIAESLLVLDFEVIMQRRDQIPPAGQTRPREALECLIQLYTDWNKPEQAAGWKQVKADAELLAAP